MSTEVRKPVDRGYEHRKAFIPLESNPTVFTELAHQLGLPKSLAFTDVLSLDEPDLLAIIPRPVLAFVLVFPTSEKYHKEKEADENRRKEYRGSGPDEEIMWFRQTIYNACGLYGILHAVSNGEARSTIRSDSTLAEILRKAEPLTPKSRALSLEDSEDLERAHAAAARKGDSAVPENPEDEVDYHYICFVRSSKNGHLYQLDGDRKGPVDLGITLAEGEDLKEEKVLDVLRGFIFGEDGANQNFSLMALVPDIQD
ncbi:ubiquitinyl hydrolase 1 [Tulasnella sp. 424]|nr:ubiquitinyl hydrolase 1 [Tulasnella sp. 424]KAG8980026.1 ubiquitinyl hydrolase 1 [Tulasnella sp. 425]